MFKYKKHQREVYNFCLFENDIFTLENLKSAVRSVFIISDNNCKLLIENEQLNSIQYFEDKVWVMGVKGVWIINPTTFNVKVMQNFYIKYTRGDLGDKNLFMTTRDDLRIFCLLNFKTNEVEWEINYSSTIFLNTTNSLFFLKFSTKLKRTIIRAFNFKSKVQIWEYNVSEIGSYRRPGEFEDSTGEVL